MAPPSPTRSPAACLLWCSLSIVHSGENKLTALYVFLAIAAYATCEGGMEGGREGGKEGGREVEAGGNESGRGGLPPSFWARHALGSAHLSPYPPLIPLPSPPSLSPPPLPSSPS